jgi:E3 ubiquitin-protein ligase SHPRH
MLRPGPLPAALVTLLESFPVEGDWPNGPPAKRPRLSKEIEECDSIEVKRVEVVGRFLQLSGVQLKEPIIRHKVPLRVVIELDPKTDERCLVTLHNQIRESSSIISRHLISTKDAPLEDIAIANIVAGEALLPDNPRGQGRLWTDIDLELGNYDGADYIKICFTLRWNTTTSLEYIPSKRVQRRGLNAVLSTYFPEPMDGESRLRGNRKWSPEDFYESVHVPEKNNPIAEKLVIPELDTELYPFQKRAVGWLLNRESAHISSTGSVKTSIKSIEPGKGYAFKQYQDYLGGVIFVSHLFGVVTRCPNNFLQVENTRGGILAEEMGLGKTVEMTALISLHRRNPIPETVFDAYLGETIRGSKATLIITPPSILKQWKSELNRHAPSLRVMHYEGIAKFGSRKDTSQLLELLIGQDVVLTTYHVLAAELHYTIPPPNRSLRAAKKYERTKSPLTQISWWRVCLDEAQMIESGVSNAAKVAKLIPRVNAWGITGTPVKKDVADLLGLLNFLRIEPFATLRHTWVALITSHRATFGHIFNTLALRHSKNVVRDEIRLPGQQRFVITVPFTPVEEQWYQSLFDEMCFELGVDKQGAPNLEDWDPENPKTIETMRTWLVRLRQSALHPEVGGRNRRALGRNKDKPLRTVTEVLDAMIENSEVAIRADQRTLLQMKLKRGQFLENGPRVKEALNIWSGALREANMIVLECREQLGKEIVQSFENRSANGQVETESSDDEAAQTESTRVGVLRNRLRNALEVQHMAIFFRANAYYQIKSNEELTKPDSNEFKDLEKLEMEGYDHAKKVRREILKEVSCTDIFEEPC